MTGLDDQRLGTLQLEKIDDPEEVLDVIEGGFRDVGASHFMASGVPLPGRPIRPLLLRVNWGALTDDPGAVDANDPLLQCPLCLHRAVGGSARALLISPPERSILVTTVGLGPEIGFVVVPVNQLSPYQAVVAAAGPDLHPSPADVGLLDVLVEAGIRRLIELKAIELSRPGCLSTRERRVVELTAGGKTAQEIADVLRISQRTVHAHLQNASNKLMAGNKTQTVVEALRYGQIDI